MAIPFFLVTGFLGSGKTTLLKQLLEAHADQTRIAIIQNEFAPGNIDGTELRLTGKSFEILEINRGSVFCVCLLSDFKSSLSDLISQYQPDVIILEATGLANPLAIGQILHAEDLRHRVYLSHVWCVVDPGNFIRMQHRVQSIQHQVRTADTVFLNKSDLSSKTELEQARTDIKAINPTAEIIQTTHCQDLPIKTLLDPTEWSASAIHTDTPKENDIPLSTPIKMKSAVLRSTKKLSFENLKRFIKQFQDKAFRIKGFVNLSNKKTWSVQFSFGQLNLVEAGSFSGPTELVAIGPEIDPEEFTHLFEQLCLK